MRITEPRKVTCRFTAATRPARAPDVRGVIAYSSLAQITRGCILTQAVASVIGKHLTGAPVEDLHRAATEIRRLLDGDDSEPTWPELAMFAPVRAVKSRHECVLLPFDAVATALSKSEAR